VKTSDRYLKTVEWSEEDGAYVGSAPGLVEACCHGDDEATVYKELCQIVEEWIRIYDDEGRPLPKPTAGKTYSGKFVVRVPPELHKALTIRALQRGESLNLFCKKALEEAV